MNIRECIQLMIDRSGMSARALSTSIGRSPGFITNSLSQNASMRFDTFAAIASATGYRVMLVGRDEEVEVEGAEPMN
ncbi:hypothetical protein HLV37_01395 [Eggerthellaceae bacterium zg-1084]|uniref:hypothetical protein n=1 Tax=Berryella wangjianweii TaxID=2734634 RepID=UPI0015578466|nr:hypothetical protein [Berryella wangjianweii]NPD30537.1 hypothetical protein [Berryella wangjianweii]